MIFRGKKLQCSQIPSFMFGFSCALLVTFRDQTSMTMNDFSWKLSSSLITIWIIRGLEWSLFWKRATLYKIDVWHFLFRARIWIFGALCICFQSLC